MKLTLLKIGAAWCPGCKALDRAGTLNKFAARHPEVKVEQHDDTQTGSKVFEKFAAKWNVKSIPVLIFTAGGEELVRTEDVSITGMEKAFEKALKRAGA